MKKVLIKIVKVICFFKSLDDKYEISYRAASISFYMLVSLISVFILSLQVSASYYEYFKDYMFGNLLTIFNENFSNIISENINQVSFSGSSIIFIINLIWSASKTINGYNHISDRIYENIKRRSFVVKRINAIIVFIFLMLTIIIEMTIIVLGNQILNKYFQNYYLLANILKFFLELILIYGIIQTMYLHIPPVKVSLKATYQGAFIATFLIYLTLVLFTFFFNIYFKYNLPLSIIVLISSSVILLFAINYSLILGFIVNYRLNIPSIKVLDNLII